MDRSGQGESLSRLQDSLFLRQEGKPWWMENRPLMLMDEFFIETFFVPEENEFTQYAALYCVSGRDLAREAYPLMLIETSDSRNDRT